MAMHTQTKMAKRSHWLVNQEVALTHVQEQCTKMCLDYIFWIGSREFEHMPNYTIKPGSALVEPFFVKGRKFTQLSDHSGVEITLEPAMKL